MLAGEENYHDDEGGRDGRGGRAHSRPEFINRVDETVVFHPLAKDELAGIAGIQLELLNRRLAEHDLSLVLSDGGDGYAVWRWGLILYMELGR